MPKQLTEAEVEMTKALAAQVLLDRLARASMVGATKKGRVIVKMTGEPTEAERRWVALQEAVAAR